METKLQHFQRVGDGKWRCVRSNDFKGPAGRVQINAGAEFTIGSNYMGVDIALELENAEHHERKAARDQGLLEQYSSSNLIGPPDSFQR